MSTVVIGVSETEEKYLGTRGNIGMMVIDALLERHKVFKTRMSAAVVENPIETVFIEIGHNPTTLLRPGVPKYKCGVAIEEYLNAMKKSTSDIIVVYDDIDFPLGKFRIKSNGGDGGHDAVRSIANCLGTREFSRLRIGIGRGSKKKKKNDFLSQPFSDEEYPIAMATINNAAFAIETFIKDGAEAAKKRFHKADFSSFKSRSSSAEKKKIPVIQTGGRPVTGVTQSKAPITVNRAGPPKGRSEQIHVPLRRPVPKHNLGGMHQLSEDDVCGMGSLGRMMLGHGFA